MCPIDRKLPWHPPELRRIPADRFQKRDTDSAASGHGSESALDQLEQARRELSRRQRRIECFGRGLSSEQAWSILLNLYVAGASADSTLEALAKASGVTQITAARWVNHLEAQGLVVRKSGGIDVTSSSFEISPSARAALRRFFDDVIIPAIWPAG